MGCLSKAALYRLYAALMGVLTMTASASACSVCGTGKEEARVAYWATTAILSFLPLVMIGGLIYYILKRSK